MGRGLVMNRELTEEFLCSDHLKYPVRIYHGKLHITDDIQNGSFIFVFNPQKLSQNEFLLLYKYNLNCIFYITQNESIDLDTNAVKKLLNDKNANEYLERIKGLQKNIMEMKVEKFRIWDIIGITASYRQLFNIGNTGYCFMEYPVVAENTMNLDDIFIQESIGAVGPKEIITKYLHFIETSDGSKSDQMNKRNAFQKVFKFYKTDIEGYNFNLDPEDIEFLVDVIKLDTLKDKSAYRAEIIGALTAVCSYFIHAGHPHSYEIVIKKLMNITPEDDGKSVTYKYISEKELKQFKSSNAFLYYHFTCRIPNQYTIALFDMYLTDTNINSRQNRSENIEIWLKYLENKILELSLINESLLWEFKRDQEICAMSGTSGLLTLYKKVCMDGDISSYKETMGYFNKAIEYAHPGERNRDINYFVQASLSSIVSSIENLKADNIKSISDKIDELAVLYANRFIVDDNVNIFDIMLSISIIAISNILIGEEKANEVYSRIGFRWENLGKVINEAPHQYASYLTTSFLLFTPQSVLDKVDVNNLVQKSITFFKLDDISYTPKGIMDIIALKFMIAHCWYLSKSADINLEILMSYKKKITGSELYAFWLKDCTAFIDDCINKRTSDKKALQLIYAIPY